MICHRTFPKTFPAGQAERLGMSRDLTTTLTMLMMPGVMSNDMTMTMDTEVDEPG